MKKNLLLIAIVALLLPPLLRGLWFYRGIPRQAGFATPDYASLTAPQAPLTPANKITDSGEQFLAGTVLIDLAHTNRFTMTEIASFTKAVQQRGGTVEMLNNPEQLNFSLRYASAFVTFSPSLAFSSGEIQSLEAFVQRGGRLLVFSDATRNLIYYDFFSDTLTVYGDADAVNPLLEPFGIVVNNDYLYNLAHNEGNYRNVFFDDFGSSELTFGLKQIALYGTHSVESPLGLILFRGAESNLSSLDDAHHPTQGGAALSRDGNVVAFGDFTFMSSPYNNYADNAILIENLAEFALSGKQSRSLETFPFVFEGTAVQVYLLPDLQLTSETIAALGNLQFALERAVRAQVEVTKKPPSGDAIILGTFMPSEELAPVLKKFGLSLNEDREFLTIADMGDIGKSGNGIVILDVGNNGNTLILLANTSENVLSLLKAVYGGSLNECLIQNNLAVCGIGSGGSFSTDESPPETEGQEEGKSNDDAEG